MLSILIPTYNYDCSKLIFNLHAQAIECKIQFEIIIAEDGSDRFITENQSVNNLQYCKHLVFKNNVGRAKIRNLLAEKAQFDNLLFIDCDAKVATPNYLKNYVSHINDYDVIFGGISYDDINNPSFSLRLKYGQKIEANPSKANFTAFNFLVKKRIFSAIRFNESISQYGHEDLIFRHELRLRNISILQIENRLIHCGLDTNMSYLNKIEHSCCNLFQLYCSDQYPFLFQDSKLLSLFLKLKKYYLTKLFALLFSIFKPILISNLISKKPNLNFLNFYKIGYLCHFATSKQDFLSQKKLFLFK